MSQLEDTPVQALPSPTAAVRDRGTAPLDGQVLALGRAIRAQATTQDRRHLRRCLLLQEDPDLGTELPLDQRAMATQHCVVAALTLAKGRWDPARMAGAAASARGLGLLVLDGLLLRRVGIGDRFGAELLGPGDLLRPWQDADEEPSLPIVSGWRVLAQAQVAVLDARATDRIGRYTAIMTALTARAIARQRALAIGAAILHHPRIELRIHMLFWHLADRWGRVRRDGIFLPLAFSHTILAELVGARRPSVTSALKILGERELVGRVDGGWMLRGDPPHDVAAGDES